MTDPILAGEQRKWRCYTFAATAKVDDQPPSPHVWGTYAPQSRYCNIVKRACSRFDLQQRRIDFLQISSFLVFGTGLWHEIEVRKVSVRESMKTSEVLEGTQ